MTRADYLAVLFAALLLPYLYVSHWSGSETGVRVSVMNGNETTHLSLAHDQAIEINGALGSSKLKIEDGKIRFIDSPCSGKQCIHSGWLEQVGDFAACLPNRISVAVLGDEPRFDSINF